MTYSEPLLFFFAIVACLGAIRLRYARGRTAWLLGIGLAGIVLVSWPPIGWLVGLPLERPYLADFPKTLEGAGAIVVLSANVLPPVPWHPLPQPDWDSFQRLDHAVLIHRRHRLPILVSGGAQGRSEPHAVVMRRFLIDQSVAPELIWVEDKSTSTFENAARSAEILRDRGIGRIVLVTNAYHMKRGEQSFRKQGIDVIPAPCAFTPLIFDFVNLLPGWRGLRASERALHEYLGLAWYRVRGYI